MSTVKSSLAAISMIAGLAAFAGQAAGQGINPLVRERIIVAQNPQTPSERRMVRIQVGINFFLPGPTNDGDEATKLRDRARRTVYEMAGRECGCRFDLEQRRRLDRIQRTDSDARRLRCRTAHANRARVEEVAAIRQKPRKPVARLPIYVVERRGELRDAARGRDTLQRACT